MKFFKILGRLICPPACLHCRKAFEFDSMKLFCDECLCNIQEETIACRKDGFSQYIDKYYAHLNYDSPYVKELIRHIKYVYSDEAGEFIAQIGKESLAGAEILEKTDLITFSPRRKDQIRKYGFDQSEEIANSMACYTGLSVVNCLERTRKIRAQKTLNSLERAENVLGSFRCTQKLKGKRVLLVDDVVTTGSTVNECAKMLKKSGAEAVYVWAIAQ